MKVRDIEQAGDMLMAVHHKQAIELVKVWTGLKNPPEWVYCALFGLPYYPNIE